MLKITITFLGFPDQYWRSKIMENSNRAARILSDPAFLAKIRAWPKFDFTNSTPAEIADQLALSPTIRIRVGFYRGWFWSKAIAYEDHGAIYFNTRKAAYGAGSVGNIAHELMHALGFSHNGNSPAGNENTVPWRIGQWAETWVPVTRKISEAVT